MANLKHILTGWSRNLGLLEVTRDERERSMARLAKCNGCPNAKQSSFLKIIRKKAYNMGAIYCSGCGCPVMEKSLVKEEKCPLGRWEEQ